MNADLRLDDRSATVAATFRQLARREPSGVWAAPGRVNLIGEHTDYNDGWVLPFALDQRVTVAAANHDRSAWTVTTLSTNETSTFTEDDLRHGVSGWVAYVAGVIWALAEAGHAVAPADFVLHSNVPLGAGLSSSAALECAVLAAVADLNDLEIEPIRRAVLARRAENEFVGAPTGLMDQAASTLCRSGHALLLDCRSQHATHVPLDLAGAGLELLVLNTNTPHALVDSEYAARRSACEQAARILGVAALRDVDDLDRALARLDDEVLRRRVRHVVTENVRVQEVVALLDAGRVTEIAPLLDASHASMRDDFEITVPTVDLAVETARQAGAFGARMTGGGFGGCIIALVALGRADEVADRIAAAFHDAGYAAPAHFIGIPSAGARRIG